MKVLLFNLATDEKDQLLAFTVRWIQELARDVDEITVITMREGEHSLPDNVHVLSVGKEKGFSEARRAVVFYKYLWRILRENRVDICFSHMIPIFSVLAAPMLKKRKIPIVTWYAHPSITYTLKVAHRVSNKMITSVETAYPYKRDKLVVVGQGIDTNLFAPCLLEPDVSPPIISCVGRLSPVKDHITLIKAISRINKEQSIPFKLIIVGGAASEKDRIYIESLKDLVKREGLEEVVIFKGVVHMEELPDIYNSSIAHVNMTPSGFGDKVALEAMACGRASIVSNEGFRGTIGRYESELLYEHANADDLADKLTNIINMPDEEYTEMGHYLRNKIIEQHSLERLGARLTELFDEILEGSACKR